MRHIAFGPYRSLLGGTYLCEVGARWDTGPATVGRCKILRAEIVLDGRLAGEAEIAAPSGTPGARVLRVPFDVPDDTPVARAEIVLASGRTPVHIDRVTIMDRQEAGT